MSMSEEERKARVLATQGSAIAFLEDLNHMHELLAAAPPDAGSLRRLSVVLRRLLVDREIHETAAPRIGRFIIDAPDEAPMIKHAQKMDVLFFATGGANMRFADGDEFEARDMICVVGSGLGKPPLEHLNKRIPLRVDNFLSQPVFCVENVWISRKKIIQFVANIANGAHAGTPKTDDEKRIAMICRAGRFSFDKGQPTFEMKLALKEGEQLFFQYSKDSVDPLLIELLATARYLAESADSALLKEKILDELKR